MPELELKQQFETGLEPELELKQQLLTKLEPALVLELYSLRL